MRALLRFTLPSMGALHPLWLSRLACSPAHAP
jgi:hypothetical protein